MKQSEAVKQLREALRKFKARGTPQKEPAEAARELASKVDALLRTLNEIKRQGRRGGEQTKKRYGKAHFKKIGKLGGRPRKNPETK